MGFSLLMTQMKSKNLNFDRVKLCQSLNIYFFQFQQKNDKKKVQKFFIQSAATAVLKKN